MGLATAFFGFLFIAFDPFEVALARFLHLDGLLSSWMILALLLYLCFLYRGRRWTRPGGIRCGGGTGVVDQDSRVVSHASDRRAGGHRIGKLLADWHISRATCRGRPQIHSVKPRSPWAVPGTLLHRMKSSLFGTFWRRAVTPALLWALVGIIIYILLWPAMWVDPLGTLQKVFAISSEYATEGHSNPLFFRGEIVNGDPGWSFYPLTWLWRVTPVVLIGVVLGLLGLLRRNPLRAQWAPAPDVGGGADVTLPDVGDAPRGYLGGVGGRLPILSLLVFALLFVLLMNLGAKKLDRYLVPIYPALALVAAYGFVVVGDWLANRSGRCDGCQRVCPIRLELQWAWVCWWQCN